MNRKTKEELRSKNEAILSQRRIAAFGAYAFAAMQRGAEKRRLRLAKSSKATQ